MMFRCWGWLVLIAGVATACGGGSSPHMGSDASIDGQGDGPQGPVCGDGVISTGETCDDGNVTDGDGCNATCTVATCFVPVTHPTIAAALLDASCTTITVYSGTYAENLTVDHAVTIRGVGATPAIVDGSQAGSVITSTAPLVLETLTVQNGRAARGGGIESSAALTLRAVHVEQNEAHGALEAYGGGIDSSGGALVIESSTVSNNRAVIEDATSTGTRTISGGGLYYYGVDAQIANGTFASNALQGHGAMLMARGGGIALDGVFDDGNAADPTKDAHFVLTSVEVTSNTIDLGTDGTARGGGVWAGDTWAWWGPTSTLEATSVHVASNTVQADVAAGGGVMIEPRSLYSRNDLGVTLTDSVIENNALTARAGNGGGIETEPTGPGIEDTWGELDLSLVRARIDGNTVTATDAKGGGIAAPMPHYTPEGAHVVVNLSLLQSSVVGNHATGTQALGGGFYGICHGCSGTFDIRETTISGNNATGTDLAADGGIGLYDVVRTHIVNSTVSGNTAQATTKARGGGVGMHSQWLEFLDLASSTIANNVATAADAGGDGLYLYGQFFYPASPDDSRSALYLSLANTILGEGCFGEIDNDPIYFDYEPASLGYNLFGGATTSCRLTAATGDQTAAPLLMPLGNNGGPTQTHALMPSSPALDTGNPAGCSYGGTALATDQRGMPRVDNGRCDIGAVEM